MELVSKIKGKKYGGSSLQDGKLYHDLPFSGFKDLSSHRGYTQTRWDYICKYISVKRRKVLDLGCSVGGFSILSSLSGANKVVGIDYDKDSIELAKYAAGQLKIKNIEFRCCEIDSKLIEGLEEFDVTIWLSQWMWLVK